MDFKANLPINLCHMACAQIRKEIFMRLRSNKSIKRAVALSLCFALAVPFIGPVSEVSAEETAPAYVKDHEQYSLVWNDEFEGDTLNTEDWNVELHEPGWVNAELQRYTKLDEGNIEVKDGKLSLIPKAEKKEDAEEATASTGNVLKGEGFDSNWKGSAGAEGSEGSVEFKDGKAEVKIVNSGEKNYAIQLQQDDISITSGHEYSLKFKAKSSAKRAVEVSLLDPQNSYAWYGGDKKVIGTEEEEIEIGISVGTDKASSDTMALQINFGKIDGFDEENGAAEVVLSDVELIDLTASQEVKYKEILKGEGFDSNWNGSAGAEGSEGSVEFKDGKAEIKIVNSGEKNYAIQLQQDNLSITAGHEYSLKFKAKSSANRAVEVSLLDPKNSYAWYGGDKKVIGTEEEEIEIAISVGTDKASTDTMALQINFGKIDGFDEENGAAEVTLSDISLLDLSEIEGTVDVKKAYNYTSGRVNTQGKQDFTYGYFEAKARVPEGQGYLPAFWLMATDEGNYGQWPKCGEVDIMEVMGQNTKQSYHTIHYGYDAGSGHRENQVKKVLETGDFSSEFHVYGLDWEPGLITWYVDGKEVGSTSDWYTGKDDESRLSYPAPFDQQFYVILNLAVGGSWVGYPDQDVVDDMANQTYDIDYVRVYQKDPEVYAEMEEKAEAPVHEVVYREADENGNYVVNGDFSKELKAMDAEGDNFELHLEPDCLDSTTHNIENNEITITPTVAGSQTHSVQLKQTGIPMFKGWEYELQFDAYADEDRTIVVDIEGPDHGWQRYFNDTKIQLTTEKQTFTQTFTMAEKTDANGSLEFNLGKQDSTAAVHISNIKLIHKSGEEIEEVFEKSVAADGNYVYNGSFDQGEGRLGYWEVADDDKANVSVTNTLAGGDRTRELRVRVEVPEGASEANPVVVSQSELAPVAKGDYEFSFDAYTTDGDKDGMTANFSGTKVNPELTAKKTTFTYDISVEDTIDREKANVSFEFTKAGTYYLDNVVFQESAMIKNGSFNSGLAGYEYGVYEEGDATFGVDSQKAGNDTAFDADIKDTGKADWNIQLKQPGVNLEKDKYYKLTFDAKATIDRTISVVMQRDGSTDDNWDVYSGDNNIELTKDWNSFELVFQMTKDTDPNSLLSVSLGTFDGNRITDVHHVYLDNFVLVETDKPEEIATPTPTATKDPAKNPTATKEPSAVTPEVSPSKEPAATTPAASPSKDPSAATPTVTPAKAKDNKTTFSIKNKATVKKTKKIKVKDKDKIKKITLNGKKIKIKSNKKTITVNLKSYKKYLKKKGKYNKLVVTDKKGNKKTLKFKTK